MVLMMVFGLSAIFADSYVAFTNKQPIEIYESNEEKRAAINTWVKSYFETVTSDSTDEEKKNASLIIVVDDQRVIHTVWVDIDIKNPKLYWVYIFDFDENGQPLENTLKTFEVETDLKTDPVTVGLAFIKEKVIQINNVNKNKVVYQRTIIE